MDSTWVIAWGVIGLLVLMALWSMALLLWRNTKLTQEVREKATAVLETQAGMVVTLKEVDHQTNSRLSDLDAKLEATQEALALALKALAQVEKALAVSQVRQGEPPPPETS